MAENVNISSADLCHAIAAISSGARNFIAIDTQPSKSIAIACPRRVLMAGIEAKAAIRQRPEIRLDIEKAVVELGTEAVLQYRAVAAPRHDNEVPESFIRSFVALRLHQRLGCQAHVERLYTAMAIDLGMPLTPDLVTVLGSFRADVALYENGRPVAIVALKVFDAASPLPSIGSELDKAQVLARFAKLRIFVGVMICPIIVSLEARIERLHDIFGGNMYVGERQRSGDQQWQWCFACASLGDREGARSY
jgi:hypothetical protein